MSVAATAVETPRTTYQPFQCLVCQSRFTRHENLKRHAALHSKSPNATSLPCDLCPATFSRADLRHRHMKRKHLGHEEKRTNGRKKQQQRSRDSQSPTAGSCSGSPPGVDDQAASPSLAESQAPGWDLGPRHSDNDVEMDGGMMPRTIPFSQRHESMSSSHSQNYTANLATSAPSSIEGGDGHHHSRNITTPFTQTTSMGEPNCISSIVQDVTDLELLGAPFLEPNTQIHPAAIPHSASFTTSLPAFTFDQGIPNSLLSLDLPPAQEEWSPSASQIARGCHLFFTHISPFAPFLHQPTFDASRIASHLLLSMLCLAYQYGEDPDCGDQEGSGVSLSERCFHSARVVIARDEERADDLTQNVSMVQAYLLLQIYAMMYLCGNNSAYGLKTHSKMIGLARAGGLAQPISAESAATKDLDSLWRGFINAESLKRTLFAAHQIDTIWYQFLSIPRQLSHLEIKHELPCPEDYWTASSSVEWAHRQLVAGKPGSPVQYPDAVRHFLSSDGDIGAIPAFDPYGAINITHFLVSSAQEISGWCTMTGMLSIERLEPLRSSLHALSPFICSKSAETGEPTHAGLCEATWESAMIEVQIWSPSHTGGIVGGSMDAVLHQLTYLAPSCEFLCESSTAKAIQPHVDWFLRYLDSAVVPDREAPWITLYAYKAFMIAWQLVSGGALGSMQVVGIQDGDARGALAWARSVFGRRQRWQLGKIIMSCLDTLEK
ncbi:hypothetical protein ACJ41O_014976 [Fusarium nematophilum]